MRKRCETHGWFEGLIYADARAYVDQAKYNKPGQAPARISTEVSLGCPLDCGLCPEHRQHTCLALIEINTACNLDCPVCFANAGAGFNLTVPEVERMLDRFVELEGHPEVVQFSGGEPTIHPDLFAMIDAATARDISYVMVNTNGVRIATDPAWFEGFAARRPLVYLQFDGLTDETYKVIRGEALLETKLRALDRLAEADLHVMLVAAIERDAGALATVRSLSRSTASILVVTSLAGFAPWILNFFVLAGVFGWNWFPDTQNVAVQFVAHTFMFGTVLGIVLDRFAFRATN